MLHALALALLTLVQDPAPVELGRVHFGRDLEAGLREARATAKPVFLLFDEVPGCATCQGFGRGPLSHPRIVEAIETLFVPVAVFNNKGDADAAALKRFSEPAWNNPVVRFVDADGRDLIPREDGVWTAGPLVERAVRALGKARVEVPPWLALLELEAHRDRGARVVLAMDCFWEGQARLGAIEGVIDARPAFHDGREVCDVVFDPRQTSLRSLVERARRERVANSVYVTSAEDERSLAEGDGVRIARLRGDVRAAPASDDLRRVRADRVLDLLPLTRIQLVRLNAALARTGRVPAGLLSPRQEALQRTLAQAAAETLAGLARPDDPGELARYERELRARLATGAR